MLTCPHCNQKGISLIKKLWSDSACPTRCSICNEYSYIPSTHKFMSGLVFYFGGSIGVLGAFYYRSIIPIIAFVLIWLFSLIAPVITTSGIPISEEKAAENKRNGNIFLLVVLSIALVIVLYTNYVNAL